MSVRSILLALSFLMAIANPLAAQANNSLRMTVSESSVEITGGTPGKEMLVLSSSKGSKNGLPFSSTRPRAFTADSTGRVFVSEVVPLRSIWFAADVESGAWITGSPAGFSMLVQSLALTRKDAANEIAEVESQTPRSYLLLLRPGKGAWAVHLRDSGSLDRDGHANGHARLAFEDTQPVAGNKERAPKHLKNGDLVVLIELGHLDLFVNMVTK